MAGYYPGSAQPRRRIGYMMSQLDVLTALGGEQMASRNGRVDPGFAQQVFESYINCKLQKGRTRYEIVPKLEELERGLPHMSRSFQLARQKTGLPPSRLFPPIRDEPNASSASSTSASALGVRRAASAATSQSSSSRQTQGAGVAAAAARPGVTNRPVASSASTAAPGADEEEAPPPPYQPTDPDPDSTRVLEESLAQAAQATDSVETAGEIMSETERRELAQALENSVAEAEAARLEQNNGGDWELAIDESRRDSDEWDRLSRRVSAPQATIPQVPEVPPAQAPHPLPPVPGATASPYSLVPHRRSLSEAGRGLPTQLNTQMSALRIPGAFPEESVQSSPLERSGSLNRPMNQQPTGSRNPFFSAATPSSPIRATAQSEDSRNPFADPISINTSSVNAGSSRTIYAPPIGPPPGHFVDSPISPAGFSLSNFPVMEPAAPVSVPRPSSLLRPKPSTSLSSSPNSSVVERTIYSPPTMPPLGHLPTSPIITSQSSSSAVPAMPARPSNLLRPKSSSTQSSSNSISEAEGIAPALPALPGQNQFFPTSPSIEPTSPRRPSSLLRNGPSPRLNPTSPPLNPTVLPLNTSMPSLTRVPTAPGRRGSVTHNHPSGEDPLTLLRSYDTVILLDDSGSMAGGRWRQATVALMDLAEQAARYDEDGIEVWFINSDIRGKELASSEQVQRLFNQVKPGGSTPTGMALEKILLPYLNDLERYRAAQDRGERGLKRVKPMNLIVITDGAPTDDPEEVVVSAARRLDRGNFPLSQLGIQFVQIGNDNEAREALQELDDNLSSKHGVRDMVDTVVYEEGRSMDAEFLVKCLLGGINRRLDRRDV